jgi:hypothetical protein
VPLPRDALRPDGAADAGKDVDAGDDRVLHGWSSYPAASQAILLEGTRVERSTGIRKSRRVVRRVVNSGKWRLSAGFPDPWRNS